MNNNNTQNSMWSLRDVWEIFLDNIWLFIISLSITISIAVVYILVTPPMYERTASLIIKSDESSNSNPNLQGFEDLGVFKSNTNINNEINMLKTTAFMTEVVDRLGLEYSYKQKHRSLRWVEIYNNSPFTVEVDSLLAYGGLSFNLSFISEDEYEISNIEVNGKKVEDVDIANFGDTIETTDGSFIINANQYLLPASLLEDGQYLFTKRRTKDTAIDLLGRFTVSLRNGDTSIVDLKLMDENRLRAENVLNTLISVYNENWIKDRNEIAFNTSAFIDDRLSIIEKELKSVDGNIAEFKSSKLITDMGVIANIQLQQNTTNVTEQLVIKNQLSMAHYIQGYLSNISGEQLLPVNTGINNVSIESQIGEYNKLLLQKNALLANSSENNPLVSDMIANLKAIKGVINTSIKDQITTLTMQLKSLKTAEEENEQRLSSTPRQAMELKSVERQQMVKEQLFIYLLQKREENELSQAFSAYNTKVIDLADGSQYPKEPKKSMLLMLALALGVILPVLYIIIKESFDTLVKSKKDLEGLNIPYVGSIPYIPTKKGKKDQPSVAIINTGSRDSGNEAFRVLRTNLDFMIDKSHDGAQIIQIISLLPSSGKSFVSANLALSMSLKESKVLLIDCDIRKKTLSSYLTTDKKVSGLSDYLSGKSDNIDKLLLTKGFMSENLDVLPVGTTPPNPSELLLKPRFGELLKIFRSQYDYIFMDCPPAEIVPDAAIVAEFCDTSIFVIRAENLDKRLLPEVEAIYESKKYNNMCLLLNGVKGKGRGYGYYGYKRYGYYSYYGYGYGTEKKRGGGNYLIMK